MKDKRYWKFQNGEMVERERTRIQSGEKLLETLRSSGLGTRSNLEVIKEQEEKRVENLRSSPPNKVGSSAKERDLSDDS